MAKRVVEVMGKIQTGLKAVDEALELAKSFKGRDAIEDQLEEANASLSDAMKQLSNHGFHDWRLVYKDGQGHRLFFDAIAGRYSIADQSGDHTNRIGTPDETDDGVLWIDPNRPCVVRAYARPDRDRHREDLAPMTWEHAHPGVSVPVIDACGEERHCGVILEFFLDGMLKEAKMRPEIEIHKSCRYIYEIMTSQLVKVLPDV